MPVAPLSRIAASLAVTVAAALAIGGCAAGAGPVAAPSTAGTSSPVARPLTLPSQALRTALGCPASVPVAVQHQVAVPATHQALVVVARCVSGAGSPPSGVYVVTPARTAAPSTDRTEVTRIEATLVAAVDQVDVDSVTVAGSTVRVRGLAYSGPGVPRCCPDRPYDRTWTAEGDRFIPAAGPPGPREPGPRPR